jgi:hypothetical protein
MLNKTMLNLEFFVRQSFVQPRSIAQNMDIRLWDLVGSNSHLNLLLNWVLSLVYTIFGYQHGVCNA